MLVRRNVLRVDISVSVRMIGLSDVLIHLRLTALIMIYVYSLVGP